MSTDTTATVQTPDGATHDLDTQQEEIEASPRSTLADIEPATYTVLKVPSMLRFSPAGYAPAPELQARANVLMDRFPELDAHRYVKIAYFWKKKGGKKGSQPVLGKCGTASGIIAHLTGADFTIWLAADHLYDATDEQIEATLYHELSHIAEETNDKGESSFKLVPHEVEMFTGELAHYGIWRPELERGRRGYAQMGLDDDEDDDAEV